MTHQSGRRGRPARSFSRVLIVGKITPYQEAIARNDRTVLKLIQAGDPSVTRMIPAHVEHQATLSAVKQELQHRCSDVVFFFADSLEQMGSVDPHFDLAVAVGGDGTVIDTSHYITRVPLLGVNSSPSTSHGHFCLANAHNFAAVLDEIAAGSRRALPVMRLRAYLDGKAIWRPALNEVFIEEPAGTSHYIVRIRGR